MVSPAEDEKATNPRIVCSLPSGYSTLATYLTDLVSFLASHTHLYSFHATDMLTSDSPYVKEGSGTSSLDQEARDELTELSKVQFTTQEWIALVSSSPPSSSLSYIPTIMSDQWSSLPPSFQNLVAFLKCKAIPRSGGSAYHALNSSLPSLRPELVFGMSPKKQHEVRLLAGLIASVGKQQNITHVLDIGAGQGYLDAVLGHEYGLTVVGVDDDSIQTCGAKWNAARISSRMKQTANVHHINRRISAEESFDDLLMTHHDDASSEGTHPTSKQVTSTQKNSWMTCCLHACGDLTAFMLRQFVSGEAQAIVNVGCCFNLLTEKDLTGESILYQRAAATNYPPLSPDHVPGYPMSRFVRSLHFPLGITARMLACQATPKWARDPEGAAFNLNKHFYRAVLQKLILDQEWLPRSLDSREIVVGKLPKSAFVRDFAHYARCSLRNLALQDKATFLSDEWLNTFHDGLLPRKNALVAAWTLRAMFSGILESLILCDRFAYLLEEAGVSLDTPVESEASFAMGDVFNLGGQPSRPINVGGPLFMLFPLFQQTESPRNMVLLAAKSPPSAH